MSKVLSSNNTPEENLEYLRSVLVPKGTQRISWEKSIGRTIEYEYNYCGKVYKGSLTIERYETKTRKIYFKGVEKGIFTGDLQRCRLGGILNLKTDKFKFEVDDIVNGLLIIDREYRTIKGTKYKYYKYRCTCTNEDWILEGNLTKGQGCNTCGDGVSYPEKFIYSILKQLNVKLKKQYSPEWLNCKRKYDFYLSDYNCIIETHGRQHGKFITKGELTFIKRTSGFGKRDDIENDIKKCWLAYDNGVENYIQLDCYYSNMEYIKNSILNSELVKKFDLSNIDWEECHKFACSNLVKEVCDYWHEHREINGEDITTKDVSKIFGLYKTTVIRYLQKGTKGWCNYDPKEEKERNEKPIYCPELNRIFTSIADAEKELKINNKNISSVLNGRAKTSGGYHWKRVDKNSNYYKNYLISKQKKVA